MKMTFNINFEDQEACEEFQTYLYDLVNDGLIVGWEIDYWGSEE